MKKLVFILLLAITPSIAQENGKTLTVVGEANKQVEVSSYFLTISLKQIVADGYQQLEPKSLVEVQQMYSDKLKAIGVDFSKYRKNILYQLHTSYSEVNDVAYYNYTSTSEEEIMKIIKQKMNGLTIIQLQVDVKEKTNNEWADLTLKAIEDAKIKAKKAVEGLGKKLGEITKVANSDTKVQYIDIYKPDEIQKHLVTVTFTIE